MKRSLAPAFEPPAKRANGVRTTEVSFESSLYDELILLIFTYLSWSDLCVVQATNRTWARLASDNELWKALYLGEYGRARLRGVRGHIGLGSISRADGREVRPLPGRVRPTDVAAIKDWKWMFRISSNWRTGRCAVEYLREPLEHPITLSSTSQEPSIFEQTHILLAGQLIITASSLPSLHPPIHIRPSSFGSTHTLLGSPSSARSARITSLALDQSPPTPQTETQQFRLASFLDTGEFAIFAIDHANPSASSRVLTYLPSTRNARNTPVVQAAYHHPLLVTLSHSFALSIYEINGGEGGGATLSTVHHTHTLTSFSSHPPASIVLSYAAAMGAYKLVLAYTVPVYPAHWSVGATELLITLGEGQGPVEVASTRTARALDVPPGWVDERKLRSVREQWGRRMEKVAGVQTDGKWVVLAPGSPFPPVSTSYSPSSPSLSSSTSSSPASERRLAHNPTHLQLYRLHLPTSPSAAAKLTFVRSLYGHAGPVTALSLADGRCVSLGKAGVWVWDLEGGAEAGMCAEVIGNVAYDCDEEMLEEGHIDSQGKGFVVFDERRIVSSDANEVRVRRFDI